LFYATGNNTFLFHAAIFWFGWILTFFLSLLPRYLVRYWKANYLANDIDVVRYITKLDPEHDFENDPAFPAVRERLRYQGSAIPEGRPSGAEEAPRPSVAEGRPSLHQLHRVQTAGAGSMTDMSTGLVQTPSRGYAFDQAVSALFILT
jgi:phospholipid-translocating ATPase